jgi:hypothetical protein
MQLLLTMKKCFTIALWVPARLSATAPASLNRCSSPQWDVSRCALNVMEDILSTCYKHILSAITYKLNFSRHVLKWKFFLVLVCGAFAQNFSVLFTYTPGKHLELAGNAWVQKAIIVFYKTHFCFYFIYLPQMLRSMVTQRKIL